MSILQSQKSNSKKTTLKPQFPRHYHMRSLTQHSQTFENQRYKNRTVNNIVLPLMQKTSEFPSILIKQNRNEYIGYKQNIINKNKLAIFQEQNKINHHQTQRKHEINLMSVEKLRKRYSLEPNNICRLKRDYQNIFLSISKTIHNDPQNEPSNSQRKYHHELRQIMRLMTINKHSSQEKIVLDNSDRAYQQRQTQNLSNSKRCQDETQAIPFKNMTSCKKQLPFFTKKIKPYYAQLKRRVENKPEYIKKQKEPILTSEKIFGVQTYDLCGWQTNSFYSKYRGNNLLQKCSFEKLKFIQ